MSCDQHKGRNIFHMKRAKQELQVEISPPKQTDFKIKKHVNTLVSIITVILGLAIFFFFSVFES